MQEHNGRICHGGGSSKDPLINADPSGTASDMEMVAGGHSMPSGCGASVANTGGSGFSGSSGNRGGSSGGSSGSNGGGQQASQPMAQNTAGDMLRAAKYNNPGDVNSGLKVAPTAEEHIQNAKKTAGRILESVEEKYRKYVPKK